MVVITVLSLLIGCKSNDITERSKNSNQVQVIDMNRMLKAENEIHELKLINQKLKNHIITLEEKAANEIAKNSRLEQIILTLTELDNFEYEILSSKIDRSPYDSVIFIPNLPESSEEIEIYVIRSAIEFSGSSYSKVSLWTDRSIALKYINGEYDPEEGYLGWSGFDQRFGFIDNTSTPPTLTHYFSRDDAQAIEFGKYSYE